MEPPPVVPSLLQVAIVAVVTAAAAAAAAAASPPVATVTAAPRPCPCEDASLCQPVRVEHEREVLGWGARSWSGYDWDAVTILAHSDSKALICRAHAAQARVLRGCEMNISEIFDGNKRVAAITRSIQAVQAGFLDGLYFDYELPLGRNQSELSAAFTSYVGEATRMLHAAIPGSKLVVATPWSPDDIDGRDYDYAGLSQNSDYLFVMNYDTRSAIYGRCIASANAPLSKATRSIQRYLDIGVDPRNLIFGLPWCVY